MILAASVARAGSAADDPAAALVEAAAGEPLGLLLTEVLERSPAIAAAAAEAAAAAQRAPQVSTLPDPMLGMMLFLQTPETRVGPQIASASFSQRFPPPGTLDLREASALAEAARAAADLQALRLATVTEARELAIELAFLDEAARIVAEDREALSRFEELARTRYATGVGTDQAVVKIQAEITRAESRLLEIAADRSSLVARINRLRDRRDGTPVAAAPIEAAVVPQLDRQRLREAALERRPEVVAAQASIEAAARRIELADKSFQPELSAGLAYTVVGHRDDADVEEEGKDIVALTGGISLPVQRARREAAVEEAVLRRLSAEERLRDTVGRIEAEISDLSRRLPLVEQRLELLHEVLLIQAEESLDSAVGAYGAGTAGALDLLDAERVLLQVRTAALRARADLAVTIAKLEGAIGGQLTAPVGGPHRTTAPTVPGAEGAPHDVGGGAR